MNSIVLDGLLLPLRIYLQPYRFRAEVAGFAPDLPADYSLLQARSKLRDPVFRREILRLTERFLIALLGVPLLSVAILVALSALGVAVNWHITVLGVVAGIAGCTAGGIAIGVAGSVAGGAALGAALGVAFSVVFSGAALGVGIGVGVGGALGVGIGVASDVVFGIVPSLALGIAGCLALGAAVGSTGGMAEGVMGGVAGSVVAALLVMHIINLPLESLISLIEWWIVDVAPNRSVALWRTSPVRWDDVILLPLPGLVRLLVELNHTDRLMGQAALAEVAAHRYQRRAAHRALVELAKEDAASVTTMPALASFTRGLDWLTDETPLPDVLRTQLFRMRDISREVASALGSDSVTNRMWRLEAAAEKLEALRTQPGEFGLILTNWSQIIIVALDDARQRQRIEEPIPQAYMSDGRPIRTLNRRDSQLPFKGRKALFNKLEAALGGKVGERATFLLYGQRRTGKTSALLQLPRRLGSQVVPVFLDLQSEKLGGAQDAVGFLTGLADEVSDEVQRYGVSLPKFDRRAVKDDPYPAIGRWFDRVQDALQDRVLLVCLDEFEALEEAIQHGRLDTRVLNMIRNTVQHRPKIAVLLSGNHQIDELPGYWASALVTTVTLPISFLDEADARELIEKPIEDFPDIYLPAAVDRIVAITHCQPYLLQLMCAVLVERMNRSHRQPPSSCVTSEDVDQAIPVALERGQNYFIDLWRSQAGSGTARRILDALAHADNWQLSRSAVHATESDDQALSIAIATLVRREIIKRVDDTYRVTVPLVAEFVKRQALV